MRKSPLLDKRVCRHLREKKKTQVCASDLVRVLRVFMIRLFLFVRPCVRATSRKTTLWIDEFAVFNKASTETRSLGVFEQSTETRADPSLKSLSAQTVL